jgi:uncharacterized protein (DUF433 family)
VKAPEGNPCREVNHPSSANASPATEDRIVIDPAVCNGRPIIRGTRITAETVLEFLGAGDSIEDVLDEYPMLTRDDVLACLRCSSKLQAGTPTHPRASI